MYMHKDDLIKVFEGLLTLEDNKLKEDSRNKSTATATAYSYGFIAGKNEGIQTIIDLLKKAKQVKKDD